MTDSSQPYGPMPLAGGGSESAAPPHRARGLAITALLMGCLAFLLALASLGLHLVGFQLFSNSLSPAPSAFPAERATIDGKAPVAGDLGSRTRPAPLGTTIELREGDTPLYEVTLGDVTLDANSVIEAANGSRAELPETHQWALVPVSLTYVGEETGMPAIDLDVEFVSPAGTSHTLYDFSAFAPGPTLTDINELYPGGSATANVIVAIPIKDAANGTWAVSTLMGSPVDYSAE